MVVLLHMRYSDDKMHVPRRHRLGVFGSRHDQGAGPGSWYSGFSPELARPTARQGVHLTVSVALLLCIVSGAFAQRADHPTPAEAGMNAPVLPLAPLHSGGGYFAGGEIGHDRGSIEWGSFAEITTGGATVALAIVTAVLAYYTYQLFKVTQRALTDARESVEISRKALDKTPPRRYLWVV